ncbi:MAG: hypothetical protein PHO27_00385 [Sulfuricurvum sp.]|nr:hypothetical protein [Sulfuricurvum sp.]
MMRFSLIALLALLAFSGCAQKGAFDLFKMDEAHERAVEQLRSGTIVMSFETKAIFSSLYLNKVDPSKYHDGEYFLVALYFDTDNRTIKNRDWETYGYSLTLNGKKAAVIESIDDKDMRRSLMPVQNNWNRYYLIRFDSTSVPSLALRLENNQTGSVELNYQKESL